jgi:hypothetical protein
MTSFRLAVKLMERPALAPEVKSHWGSNFRTPIAAKSWREFLIRE